MVEVSNYVVKAGTQSASSIIRAIGEGKVVIRTTLNGETYASEVQVVSVAKLSSVSVSSVGVSSPGVISVYLDATVSKDTVVNLSQTGTGVIAGLPSTVTVRTQGSSAQINLLGMTAGMGTLTGTLGTTMKTASFAIAP